MDIRNNWGEKKNFFSTALHIDVYLAIFALQPRLLTDPRRPPKCVLFDWPPSYHHVPSSKGNLSNASHEVVPDANAPEACPGFGGSRLILESIPCQMRHPSAEDVRPWRAKPVVWVLRWLQPQPTPYPHH